MAAVMLSAASAEVAVAARIAPPSSMYAVARAFGVRMSEPREELEGQHGIKEGGRRYHVSHHELKLDSKHREFRAMLLCGSTGPRELSGDQKQI
jgi:hypothetical protein